MQQRAEELNKQYLDSEKEDTQNGLSNFSKQEQSFKEQLEKAKIHGLDLRSPAGQKFLRLHRKGTELGAKYEQFVADAKANGMSVIQAKNKFQEPFRSVLSLGQ